MKKESNDSTLNEEFDDKDDELFFEILQISEEDAPRDFNSIKSVYRKKIAQYHPDKVSAMGPEITEVAEQKAKEINEAYEHFRKKFLDWIHSWSFMSEYFSLEEIKINH